MKVIKALNLHGEVNLQTGIVICTRYESSRIPGKVVKSFNGKPLIWHLVNRLNKTCLPIVIAYPTDEHRQLNLDLHLKDFENVHFYESRGFEDHSPLHRMHSVAVKHGFDRVIRICTDKIFVDPDELIQALNQFGSNDYLYSSSVTPGCGFEIISYSALRNAAVKFNGKFTEHISYAIRAVSDKTIDFKASKYHANMPKRLLLDYPEDTQLIEIILSTLGNDCTNENISHLVTFNPWLNTINKHPLITIYTCAYNAEKYINECLNSVLSQDIFNKCEYILVDDFSNDKTTFEMAKFSVLHPNVKFIRNEKNQGLAYSSNLALENAKGKYIIRLDADDFFTTNKALSELVYEIERCGLDAVYPNNYRGTRMLIQKGDQQHHIGGSLFKRSAINHIKFNNALRGLEGYDFYQRSYEQLKIGYLDRPLFFYRQTDASMSKTNLEYRKRIKETIEVLNP